MNYFWPALLQLLAFAVGIAEVIVVSFGFLAALCAALAIYSWYFIVTRLPHGAMWGFGAADLLLLPVAIKIAFSLMQKSSISHGSSLGVGSGLESVDQKLHAFVGQVATVEAALRPTGKIRFDADLIEAQTSGDFVEKGAQVKVLSVAGSRFQVEKI